MQPNERIALAGEIMDHFAERTGLVGESVSPRRYLWTDAFAVCNFLELGRLTGNARFDELARRLVDQTHHVLGRHRGDDGRHGWLSGLADREGEEHPTLGGLRIGKPLPERRADEPLDEEREWDRDGQYYHYLTKWLLALNRIARRTGEERYLRWAFELARAAQAGFAFPHPPAGTPLLHWKMSIDLSRPQVPGMGHHDPLDGLLTLYELQIGGPGGNRAGEVSLADELSDLERMCRDRDWLTDDPLGLGGLLSDALLAARLMAADPSLPLADLLADLLAAGARGLTFFAGRNSLHLPAAYRLAFRELGLAIGLHAAERLELLFRNDPELRGLRDSFAPRLREILSHKALSYKIDQYWLSPDSQRDAAWTRHQDINSVMLATSLIPDGYFGWPSNP
ncbi:MAG: hypothetical protein C4563_06770 [Desulfobulbus sp.]|nr:MAG: hypothetical protein C4563_06770 [Desulfobulbus sp.]